MLESNIKYFVLDFLNSALLLLYAE